MYSGEGIVLRRKVLREDDFLVTLLTKEYGKLSLAVRSGAKIKSKLSPPLANAHRIEFAAVKGQEIDTLTFSAILERFGPLEASLEQRLRALQLVEAVDRLVGDHVADRQIYDHLSEALRVLGQTSDAVRAGKFLAHRFLWVLLHRLGTGPEVRFCVNCRKVASLSSFSVAKGGMLCASCHGMDAGAISVPPRLIPFFQLEKERDDSIASGDLALFSRIVYEWVALHLSRPLNSFSFTDTYVSRG